MDCPADLHRKGAVASVGADRTRQDPRAGEISQGRRPAFTGALEPVAARALYEQALSALRTAGVPHVAAGEFAADMQVELVNDGPVTILLDSRKLF